MPCIGLGQLDLTRIEWVIVGGESGPSARPMKLEWVENIRQQCEQNNIPFFFKQWGTWGPNGVRRSKKKNGRLLTLGPDEGSGGKGPLDFNRERR